MTNFYHVSIDPGVPAIGVAIWGEVGDTAQLHAAAAIRRPDVFQGAPLPELAVYYSRQIVHALTPGHSWRPERVYVESMVAVRDRATTPQDLIDVQTVGVLTAAALGWPIHLVRPSDWKPALSKSVHHRRIWECLDPLEHEIAAEAIGRTTKAHAKEIMDAIGIGLVCLGRMDRKGGRRT